MKKRVIGILLTLTMLLSLLPVAAFAATEVASGTCGDPEVNEGKNVTWSLDSDGVLTISGTGAMASDLDTPWKDYSADIRAAVIENGVTNIGSYAFYDCANLSSAAIPDSVTSIDSSAFLYCKSLANVTIPNSVKNIGFRAFFECVNLTNVIIPNGVKTIGIEAFYNCAGLMNVEIPSSATSIGAFAFHGCSSLTSVTIPNSVTSIGESAFAACDSLAEITVESENQFYLDIGGVLFNADKTLLHSYPIGKNATTYSIPASVTDIGENAFYGCLSLTNVTIPNSVERIGFNAFGKCAALKGVTIPNGVTVIEGQTFVDCISLTSVTIPFSVTEMGARAFQGCNSLVNITIPDSVTNIGVDVFNNTYSLADIYYSGTEEDWNAAVGDNNLGLSESVIIHYNSTAYTITWLDEDDTVLTTTLVEVGETPAYDAPAKSGYSFYGWDPTPVPAEADATYTAIYHKNSVSGGGGTATIAEGYCGDPNVNDGKDVTWTLSDGVLTISGTGAMANQDNWHDYYADINVVVVEDGVTSIGNMAFYKYYSALTEVHLASSVLTIGDNAFNGSGLTEISFPSSLTSIGNSAFDGCAALTSVTIPDGVTRLPHYVFGYCTSLTSVTIPQSVTVIEYYAFEGCDALTDIYFGGTEAEWISATTADGNIILPDDVTVHYGGGSGGSLATRGGTQVVGSDGTNASVSGTVISADPDAGTVNISGVELTYANGFNGVKLGKQVEGKSVDIDLDRSGRIATYEISVYGTITAYITNESVSIDGKKYTYSDSLAEEDRIAAWVNEHCNLYLDGSGEVIGWWLSRSGSGLRGITMVSDTGYVEDGVKYTYASSFVGDKLTWQVLGCDVGSWSRDNSGAITRIYYVTYYGTVKAADTNGVTIRRNSEDERTFPYTSSFAGSKLGASDVDSYMHLKLNAKGEITDYYYDVDGELVSADSSGITLVLDGGETATYQYPSGYSRTKLTNDAAQAARYVNIYLNSNRQIDHVSLSGAYGYIFAADPTVGTVSILESGSSGEVRTYTCDSNFNGAPVSTAFIGCRISTSLNINGKLSWYHIYADDKNDFRSQTLPNAVKFVPYSVNLLDVIKSVYPEGDCTYQVTSGLPAWLTVNKDTSELSGIPTETGSCGFQMKVTVGTVNETWVFTLDVKDNTTAAVTQEVAPELKIEQTVSNMTTTNLTDQVFEIEDKVEDENESNFDKFMEVYLDGVLLVGGKIGENETVKTVEDVPDEWEYYAEEGSTKITVRAQTFEKKAAAGTHTIAATFSKTDPETGEQTTMTAAQNFTISTPGGGGSSSSSKTTKNETKDNGTIKYTVKDGVAQLDAKSMDKLTESAKENSVLTLDFTTAGQTVTTAKLPAGMIDKLAKLLADDTNKAQSLAVKLTSGALTFDAASLAEIAKQAGNAELSLSLTEVAASSLSAQQQEALTAIGAEKVFSVEIKAGDKQVADFGGGRVTLGVPFTVPAGRDARGYAVWHLAENGGTNRHSTAYAGGSLSFRTAHFSYYAVAYQEAKSFNDVPNGLWFASDVNHMVSLGLMSGVGGSSFAPDMELNRAMVAQILYNLEKAEAGASVKFEDVPETAWYADAVNWAAEAGVVEGVGDGRFEPMRAVTRGELVAMLYKYAAYKQYSVSNVAALDRFPDSNTLPDWTKGAMQWAVGTKLISGINGKLADQETATRAQAAKVLTYFMEMYEA